MPNPTAMPLNPAGLIGLFGLGDDALKNGSTISVLPNQTQALSYTTPGQASNLPDYSQCASGDFWCDILTWLASAFPQYATQIQAKITSDQLVAGTPATPAPAPFVPINVGPYFTSSEAEQTANYLLVPDVPLASQDQITSQYYVTPEGYFVTVPPAAVPPPVSSAGPEADNSGAFVQKSGPGGPNSGVGQYIPTQSFLMSPAGQAGIRGLGCACGCGGCGCGQPGGMGTLGDGTGLLGSGLFNGNGVMGSGLFESGFDPSTWGAAEWAVVALGGYVAWSVFFTTKAGIGYASTVPARTKRAARSVKSSFL